MSENWKVQASFKFGVNQTGLLNVRGDSPADLKATLAALGGDDIISDITATNDLIRALDNVSQAGLNPQAVAPALDPALQGVGVPPTPLEQLRQQAQQPPPQQNEWNTPQPAAPGPPQDNNRTCLHGARTYVTGNKNGRQWAAWMCPTAQGAPDKCAPQWA